MKLRFNVDHPISARLRAIKVEYDKKFAPCKISLQSLATLVLECGTDNARLKLNLTEAPKRK